MTTEGNKRTFFFLITSPHALKTGPINQFESTSQQLPRVVPTYINQDVMPVADRGSGFRPAHGSFASFFSFSWDSLPRIPRLSSHVRPVQTLCRPLIFIFTFFSFCLMRCTPSSTSDTQESIFFLFLLYILIK